MKRITLGFLALALGCGGVDTEHDPAPAHEPSAEYDVQSAGLTAARSAEVIGDVAQFVRDGLGLTAGPLGGAGLGASGFVGFSASGQCSRSITFGGRQLTLEHDCTTPGGRRVRGSLSIDLNGGQCTTRGLSVEISLAVESVPGAGDEILLDGRVAFGVDARRLFFAVSLEHQRTWDTHSIVRSINGCFIVDGVEHVVAMNGHVRTELDGTVLHNLEIRDLQHGRCRALPHTGTVLAETLSGRVEIVFDGSSPNTSIVTVTAQGQTNRVELSASTNARFCDQGHSTPLPIDYSVCGDCGQPPPGGGGMPSDPPQSLAPPDF